MKNKFTIILSAALGVVSIIAIATPIGVAVSNQQKINDLANQINEIKEKTIKGLQPTDAFTTIVNGTYASETVALEALNAVEDKKTLFTVVNENGNELAVVKESLAIGANFSFSHQPTDQPLEVTISVTSWGASTDYHIPNNLLNQVSLVWGGNTVSAASDSSEKLNGIEGVSTATTAAELQGFLNAEAADATVLEAIYNGDKIILGTIVVAAADPASNGYNITIPYTVKEGELITFPTESIVINGFKINASLSFVENHINILSGISGVREASTATLLQTALNAASADATVLEAINNSHAINLGDITVANATEGDGFNITIPYTVKNGFNVTGTLTINNFEATPAPTR